jgi:hypothetical protein
MVALAVNETGTRDTKSLVRDDLYRADGGNVAAGETLHAGCKTASSERPSRGAHLNVAEVALLIFKKSQQNQAIDIDLTRQKIGEVDRHL